MREDKIVPFGGNMVDSSTTLQAEKGDDKHAIYALAVAQGDTAKAVAKLSGQHAERILLVIDEGQATPEAIYATIPNLRKACRDLTIIVIENPSGKLTPSGRASEPADGWNSIGEDSTEWRTKGVPEWQYEPGVAIRFDGTKSPNVEAAIKAGVDENGICRNGERWKDPWPFIYTYADSVAAMDPERINTLSYWVQDRGFQPPDGTLNTVLTSEAIERNGREPFLFHSSKRTIAFLDPAFGGDKCILQFAEVGKTSEDSGVGSYAGKEGIQLTEFVELIIDPSSGVEIERQIAEQTKSHCQMKKVAPHDFGLDATAIGRGVAYAIAEIWNPNIRRVEFGGLPSERAASPTDYRPEKEVYDRKVTALWFRVREMVLNGQLRGIYREAEIEFIARTYEIKSKKYSVMKKTDMKEAIGYSPDHADAIAGVCEVAMLGGFDMASTVAESINDEWESMNESEELEAVLDGEDGGWGLGEV